MITQALDMELIEMNAYGFGRHEPGFLLDRENIVDIPTLATVEYI